MPTRLEHLHITYTYVCDICPSVFNSEYECLLHERAHAEHEMRVAVERDVWLSRRQAALHDVKASKVRLDDEPASIDTYAADVNMGQTVFSSTNAIEPLLPLAASNASGQGTEHDNPQTTIDTGDVQEPSQTEDTESGAGVVGRVYVCVAVQHCRPSANEAHRIKWSSSTRLMAALCCGAQCVNDVSRSVHRSTNTWPTHISSRTRVYCAQKRSRCYAMRVDTNAHNTRLNVDSRVPCANDDSCGVIT
jgi:hypothetical protein